MTPLERAVKEDHTDVIEYFAKECKLNIEDLNDVCGIICVCMCIIFLY